MQLKHSRFESTRRITEHMCHTLPSHSRATLHPGPNSRQPNVHHCQVPVQLSEHNSSFLSSIQVIVLNLTGNCTSRGLVRRLSCNLCFNQYFSCNCPSINTLALL